MKKEVEEAFKKVIGEVPTVEIIKTTTSLRKRGLCSREEEDDIANDLYLLCVNIINEKVPTRALMDTYLVTAIQNKKIRIVQNRQRDRFLFCPLEYVSKTPRNEHDEVDEENFSYEDDEITPLSRISFESPSDHLANLEIRHMVSALSGTERKVVDEMLQLNITPRAACIRLGLHPMFFKRKVLPKLEEKFKNFCDGFQTYVSNS